MIHEMIKIPLTGLLAVFVLACGARDWVSDPADFDEGAALQGRPPGELGTEAAYTYYATAELLYENGDLEGALEALERALAADRSDPYLAARLAVLLIEAGDYSEARRRIDAVLKRTPKHAATWLALAKLHHAKGEEDKAEVAARRAIRGNPREVEAALWLADIKQKRGQNRYAAELLTQARENNPYSAAVLLALGRVSLDLGQYAEARRHLAAYLMLWPERSDVIAELARAHEAAGEKKEAADLMALALEKAPTNEALRLELIALSLDLGLPLRAERHIRSLPALDEADREGVLIRARLFAMVSLDYEARNLILSQLERQPQDPELRLALAAVEIHLGRLEAADLLLRDDAIPWSREERGCRADLRRAIEKWPSRVPTCGLGVHRAEHRMEAP